ncbi:hypothetical protein L9F63_021311, partial [Diploptera punctata]
PVMFTFNPPRISFPKISRMYFVLSTKTIVALDISANFYVFNKRLVTNKMYVSSHELISAHFLRVHKHHVIPTLTPLTPHIGLEHFL